MRIKAYRIELKGCFSFRKTSEGEEMAGVGLTILDADWSVEPANQHHDAVAVIREEHTGTQKDKEKKTSQRCRRRRDSVNKLLPDVNCYRHIFFRVCRLSAFPRSCLSARSCHISLFVDEISWFLLVFDSCCCALSGPAAVLTGLTTGT